MIPVPFWVAVALMTVGALLWLAEQPKKARKRREAREARAALREDLTAPPVSTQLPYGLVIAHGDESEAPKPPVSDSAGNSDLEAWQLEAVTLATKFEQSGDVRLLREAIALFRRVAFDPRVPPEDRAGPLGNLGKALTLLAELSGDITDLRDAVEADRATVAAASPDDPNRVAYLNDLGNTLRALAEQTPDADLARALLAEAAQAAQEALAACSPDDPSRPVVLTNLSNTLQSQYAVSGDLATLAEAVHCARGALGTLPADDPHEAAYLVNLGEGLRTMGEQTGDVAVLQEAARIFQTLEVMTAQSNPHRGKVLNNMALVLQALFERTGDTVELDGAVHALREAINSTQVGGPELAASLGNLGVALQLRFERTGDEASLTDAISTAREAVRATPEVSRDQGTHLNNLGAALRLLHQVTGENATLRESVEAIRQAIHVAGPDHPEYAGQLANLCGVLHYAYRETKDDSALDEAIDVGWQAAQAISSGDPKRAAVSMNLAHALRADYERGGIPDSLANAARWFREAGRDTTAPISVRVEAYRCLARLPIPVGQAAAERLADVEDATALLPRVAPAALARPDREHGLGGLLSFAGDAAATAVNAGNPVRAVELLEQTRGILVADSIEARGSDMARLRVTAPELADQLSVARARLDAAGAPRSPGPPVSPAVIAQARRDASAAWDELVIRARQVMGQDFLRPPTIRVLAASAVGGPFIYLYTSTTRCDALVLTDNPTTPVRVVPLPKLTEADAMQQVARLLEATSALADPEILSVLEWVREVICDPVLEALGHTSTLADADARPRVWWCPVGLLGYLPLHAAVLDQVVSSYAISARALADARDATRARPVNVGKVGGSTLVVSVPDAPDVLSLPGAAAEAEAIRELIPDAVVLPRPTRDRVLRELPGYAVVHLSCHGEADMADPASSRLILPDHATAPLTVADIAGQHANGALAFLSACSTSRTSPALSNEAIHLTGAFHLSGFQNVIGSLWPVFDDAASKLTKDFYSTISSSGTLSPDATQSALALHGATCRLRDAHPEAPGIWAPFTHTGL